MKRLLKNKKTVTAISAIILGCVLFAGARFGLNAIYIPVILMYHSVQEEDNPLSDYKGKLNVTPEVFRKQMKFLKDHEYTVIPLEEFAEKIKSGEKIPPKTVAITFDDGLKNNLQNACPVLRKYGFPATIFVAVNFVGGRDFMTWDQINTLDKDLITIGSHSVCHYWMTHLDDERLERELAGSRRVLEEMTGREIKIFSYPLNDFDERCEKAARGAGYIAAVASSTGMENSYKNPYALKRVRISMTSENPVVFRIQTSGYYSFIQDLRDD